VQGGPQDPRRAGSGGQQPDPDATVWIGDGRQFRDPEGSGAPATQTLREVLRRRRLSPGEVGRIGSQLAGALAETHRRSGPRGSIDPDAVLVGPDGGARFTDPGPTRSPRSGQSDPRVPYLAPEQVRGDAPGPAADVYALGLVLLEALTGEQAYPGSGLHDAQARLHAPPLVPNDVPAPLARALLAMTELSPAGRPSAERAAGMLGGGGGPAPAAVATAPTGGLNKWAAFGLPVGALVIILLIVLFTNSSTDDSSKNTASGTSASSTAEETTEPTSTPTTRHTTKPTKTTAENSGSDSGSGSTSTAKPTLPSLPSFAKPTLPNLPDAPSASDVTTKVQSAWDDFKTWLATLF
jgi:serine/threonine protein kinase